ncbi:hypothetical protein LINGRAHAP2_LOCUS5701 [Linum grandiflorum]
MAADELHECDIVFPCDTKTPHETDQQHQRRTSKKKRKQLKSSSGGNSVPVNIPRRNNNVFRFGDRFGDPEEEEYYEDDYEESDEVVPPHVILGRRVAGKMAFSVCTGNGRTLKGRDLSQVRNSILRMTGFLET